jgi:D-alanyl-D-alanine carboxypeptidase
VDLRAGLARVVETGVPGALGLTGDGGSVQVAATGVADMAADGPLTPQHRFGIGSIAKTFVATVVLQLVTNGRLGLDDSVEAHLPGVVAYGREITIRQLLNHTSGIPDYFFACMSGDRDRVWTPRELVALSRDGERGERGRWAYSNTNYVLLGLLIEAVSGTSVERELERLIIEPLDLRSTGDSPTRADRAPRAHGYLEPSNPIFPFAGSALVDVTEIGLTWAWPTLVSNAEDVARFFEALLRGDLLPVRMLDEMLDGVDADWVECERYGLGIEEITSLMGVSDSPLGAFWGHLGLGLGQTVVALASKDGRRRTVVMVNQGMIGEETWRAIGDVAWTALNG